MREFLKKGAQLAAGPALGQLLAFAALPIIARLYSADQFGTFSVFIVFLQCFGCNIDALDRADVVSCKRSPASP